MRRNLTEKMVFGMTRTELSIVVCSLYTQEQTDEECPQNTIQRAKRLMLTATLIRLLVSTLLTTEVLVKPDLTQVLILIDVNA